MSNSFSRGMNWYLSMYSEITKSEHTASSLAAMFGVKIIVCQRLIYSLHRHKLVHITGWVSSGKGQLVPIYANGSGIDAPYKGIRREQRTVVIDTMEKVSRALVALNTSRVTVNELAERAGIHIVSASELTRAGKALGLFRISDWLKRANLSVPGAPVAVWTMGSQADAPKPVWCKKTYERKKAKEYTAKRRKLRENEKARRDKALAAATETIDKARRVGGYSVFNLAEVMA